MSSKNFVASLEKGLKVLECFSENNFELTISEISSLTKLDSGTTFRLVNTLIQIGYLEKNNEKKYRLSFKVCDLGFNAIGRTEIRKIIRPLLRELVGEINEAASFGILDGTDVVYIDRVQAGLVRLGVDIKIGSRIPSYYTAIGLTILAYLPKDDAINILNSQNRLQINPNTKVSLEELIEEIEIIKRQNWAYTEPAPALRVLATPVLDNDNYPLGSISVAGLSTNISKDEFTKRTLKPLLEIGSKLGTAISISGVNK